MGERARESGSDRGRQGGREVASEREREEGGELKIITKLYIKTFKLVRYDYSSILCHVASV